MFCCKIEWGAFAPANDPLPSSVRISRQWVSFLDGAKGASNHTAILQIVEKDMANLYLDLSFDVIWVFNEEFGPPPEMADEERWTSSKISLIDAEMKSLTDEVPMSREFRRKLQKRFVKTSFGSDIQLGLLQYLADEVTKYISFKKKRAVASQLTNNLLFVLVRLMGELHSLKTETSA